MHRMQLGALDPTYLTIWVRPVLQLPVHDLSLFLAQNSWIPGWVRKWMGRRPGHGVKPGRFGPRKNPSVSTVSTVAGGESFFSFKSWPSFCNWDQASRISCLFRVFDSLNDLWMRGTVFFSTTCSIYGCFQATTVMTLVTSRCTVLCRSLSQWVARFSLDSSVMCVALS